MAGTQINQNQINLGSETAIDLLAMQNGWKASMITALNNKIANYASDADTMNTVVSKFMGMTGSNPDTVYKVFKGVYYGTVRPVMSAMPTTSNDSWEITVCQKKIGSSEILVNRDNNVGGIYLSVNIGNQNQGYANGYLTAKIPVYKQDESQELEELELNWSGDTRYAFRPDTKYWIKLGYGNGKYYCKVSTDNNTYDTAFEITSARKTQCKGVPASPDTPYLDIWLSAGNIPNSDILWLKECKVVIDNQTIFDGNDNLVMGTDITWTENIVHLVDVIQL